MLQSDVLVMRHVLLTGFLNHCFVIYLFLFSFFSFHVNGALWFDFDGKLMVEQCELDVHILNRCGQPYISEKMRLCIAVNIYDHCSQHVLIGLPGSGKNDQSLGCVNSLCLTGPWVC